MAKFDPELAAHRAWLGLVQPVGLVVSPPALVKAQAVVDRNMVALQQTLLALVRRPLRTAGDRADDKADVYLDDFPAFAQRVLRWEPEDLAGGPGGPALAEDLEHALPHYGDTLRPTYALVDGMDDGKILLLVQIVAPGTALDSTALDRAPAEDSAASRTGWQASPQARLERLLREKKIAAGLLSNGHELRLVYAPSGESSGHLTFPVPALCEVAGRPLLGALHMLLSAHRVLGAPDGRRLLDLLAESRKYQSEVSTKLSEQVLGALWDLLAGFQAADEVSGRYLVDQTAREDPAHVYGGLLTVLLRLVFLLYAEDEGLMPDDEVYARNYSLAGLYERLRADAGRHPDTMDQRYGAWAWLLSLFRLLFDGGGHRAAGGGGFHLPTRHGQLFNPDEYPFLEGRRQGVARVMGERIEAPRVSDGCVYRVLEALLVLDGERLSYRALDVEQIGSVYEAMMGFEVERAFGRSIAVKPKHVVFNVDAVLEVEGGKRKKWLKDHADCEVVGKSAIALNKAESAEDVVAALGRKISPRTPRLLAPGALYLQPGEERRRSGSHYTPRELTEPIVRTTLRPVLEALGERPTPEQILDLKVCDPAMGSGAFLVEACRQLAKRLVEAWEVHKCLPDVPPDEDPLLHARRLVAQRCLYGVDKNPFAVNLAKLSLWLVTLAKDHAFTFLDHALKCGDSLVGLTREQIAAFHWQPKVSDQVDWIEEQMQRDLAEALGWRDTLQELDEGDYGQKKQAWWQAENALADARLIGDLAVAAFFVAEKAKDREELRNQYGSKVEAWRAEATHRHELEAIVEKLRRGDKPVSPLHWEIEFPEVFARENPGFDAMMGNPPFAGKNTTIQANRDGYVDWLKTLHIQAHGAADLVAHFFRRAFRLLRREGTLGLIATNTIGEGDTRSTGLRMICAGGGRIYNATRRLRWPGLAAVVVSVVHIQKGIGPTQSMLDGEPVSAVTAFLFHAGSNDDPHRLHANAQLSFQGSTILGLGFTFNDRDKSQTASTIADMKELVRGNHANSERIFPYIGGSEVNTSPKHEHHRYVINFEQMSEVEARQWPNLMAIVEDKVKPERQKLGNTTDARGRRKNWWLWSRYRPALFRALKGLDRVLVRSQVSTHHALTFLENHFVFDQRLVVFPLETFSAYCTVQSAVHDIWARFFGASLKDDLSYTPSDCFETFPFPTKWQAAPTFEAAGRACYEFRTALMIRNNEGLTKTYNRFHDPEEHGPDILKLRELHAAMDRAVLDAYGWDDIATDCEFLLDYEIDEETWSPRKKKPYRYRWPESVHDEVLARLLDLNQERYQEEVLAGLHADKKGKKKGAAKAKRKKAANEAGGSLPLFDGPPDVDEDA